MICACLALFQSTLNDSINFLMSLNCLLSSWFSNTVTFPALLDAITVYKPSCFVFSSLKQFRLSDVNNSASETIEDVHSMISLSGGLMCWIITL